MTKSRDQPGMETPQGCFYSCLFKTIDHHERLTASSNQEQNHDMGKRQQQHSMSIPGLEDGGGSLQPSPGRYWLLFSYFKGEKNKSKQKQTKETHQEAFLFPLLPSLRSC